MNGELDKSNSVLYNEVLSMKEKHYPFEKIQSNKEKVDHNIQQRYQLLKFRLENL